MMKLEEDTANLEVEILELKEKIKDKRKELELLTQQYRTEKALKDSGQKTLDEVDEELQEAD